MKDRSLLWICSVSVVCFVATVARSAEREEQEFRFTYSCEIIDLPEGASRVDLWMPVPVDCDGQIVKGVEVLTPGGSIAVEGKYGNRIFHKRFVAPLESADELAAKLAFDVARQEIEIPEAKELAPTKRVAPPDDLNVYLTSTRLIPIDGRIAKMAIELDLPRHDPILTGRALFDHLIETMTYNWKAEGAGVGDVLWACDSKTGDCTDYHSVFIALCRACGIPADHEFGFPIRSPKSEGRIPSYHCWARFWVDGIGWIPIDISESDKHPEQKAYNFGSLSARLLKMSHGRDVTLIPPQQAEPLNIFVHPYVEVDGKPHKGITWEMTFMELGR